MSRELSRRALLRTGAALGAGSLLSAPGCRPWETPARVVRALSPVERLASSLEGELVLPSSEDYDSLRRVASFNPETDLRPGAIVRCATPSDVARALDYGLEEGLEIAVRSGGHDVLGRSVCQGGVVIDLSLLREVQARPEKGLVRVGAGARAGQVNDALAPYGLAAALGCNPAVGVGGLTLGGGLGWLLGRHGATCDTLEAVELVTVDGRHLRASETENGDLFWALQGGGGNFGIATAFEYRLAPVDRVVGGYLVYAGRHARDFLRTYRDLMAAAPDELTVEVVILPSPEPPHGPAVVAVACFSGLLGEAEEVLRPLRRLGPPVVDLVRETPYARLTDPPQELQPFFGGPPPEDVSETRAATGGFNAWRGASLTGWPDEAIDAFLACAEDAPRGWSMGLGHYLHGEICRVPEGRTPLPRRPGSTSYFMNAGWGEPERAQDSMSWVERSMQRMAPHSDVATYVNYLSRESEEAVAAAYGDNYRRLREIKRRYDPDNVFRLNRNVRPG